VPGSAVVDLPPRAVPVLFVGEAPGRLGAARTGIPFVGDVAGERFDRLLEASGLDRADVAVTNAVLCLPFDARGRNRRPTLREIRACAPHLAAALEATRPALVVALGTVALAGLAALAPHTLALRRDVALPSPWAGRWLVPLYHPSARTAAHRPFACQLDDWRRLGMFVRASVAGPSNASANTRSTP
jgi:uracil-DNA glycosylase family 4